MVLAARQGSLGSSRSISVSGAMLLSHQSAIVAGLLSLLFYDLDTFVSYVEGEAPSRDTWGEGANVLHNHRS